MADVEEALVGEAPSVQELRASDAPEPGSTQRPGGITRHSRSQSPDKTSHALRRSSSPSPSRKAEWKTFSKEYPHKRADVPISDYSKDETIKRKRWEKEKRALRERQARLVHERAEAEATKQRELQERQASEHKARVKERLKKQEAKIRRAAEERLRREKAYQDLLSKTRECDANRFLRKGLLFERLQEAGDSKVNAIHQEKQTDYVNTLGRVRKLGAQEIATRPELHPSLRVVQRRQQEEILKREAGKEPNAFTPKAAESPVAGSPVSSFMTTRRMPGSSLSGGLVSGAAATGHHGPPKPARRRRPARTPVRPRAEVTERASSPLSIPGVDIHVDGVLYEVPVQKLERHTSGAAARRSSSINSITHRGSVSAKPAAVLAQSPSASFSQRSPAGATAQAAATDEAAPSAAASITEAAAGQLAPAAVASDVDHAGAEVLEQADAGAAAAGDAGGDVMAAAEETAEDAAVDAEVAGAADDAVEAGDDSADADTGGGSDAGGEEASAAGVGAGDVDEAGEDYSSADDDGDDNDADDADAAIESGQDGDRKPEE